MKKHANRTPVPPARPMPEEIQTRDPQPVTRDPERQHPCIVRVAMPKCAACGCATFRNGGTSIPNVSTAEMFRYRVCAHCGKAHHFAVPMTEAQKAQYNAV